MPSTVSMYSRGQRNSIEPQLADRMRTRRGGAVRMPGPIWTCGCRASGGRLVAQAEAATTTIRRSWRMRCALPSQRESELERQARGAEGGPVEPRHEGVRLERQGEAR